MTFLFVDRILQLDKQRVLGIKHVTASDRYLTRTVGGEVILMPSIVGETLGQLAAWSVMQANEFSLRPVAGVVGQVEILGLARLGDTLELAATLDSVDESAVMYQAVASVKGQPILKLHNALGPMLPMADFIAPEVVRQQFTLLNRPADISLQYVDQAKSLVSSNPVRLIPIGYDLILAQDNDRITAQKNVSFSAPFWPDHFPRKPVLPLSVLLEAKLNLACYWLAELLGQHRASEFYPRSLSKIKMSDFVVPGDSVVTQATLKEKTDDLIKISFRSHVADKRVCVAEAEFVRD